MKKYVVAIVDFFENQVKQYQIQASDEFNAVKQGMIAHNLSDKAKKLELDYQNSDDYPKTMEELEYAYEEMSFSVTRVADFYYL